MPLTWMRIWLTCYCWWQFKCPRRTSSLKINFPLCLSLGSSWEQGSRWGITCRWFVREQEQNREWGQPSTRICEPSLLLLEATRAHSHQNPQGAESTTSELSAYLPEGQERADIHWRLLPHWARVAPRGVNALFFHTCRRHLCKGHTQVLAVPGRQRSLVWGAPRAVFQPWPG